MVKKSSVLRAFSSLPRIKLFLCLKDKEKNVSELIKNCGLSQSAVSQHLKKLKNFGLVSCQKQGKEVYYKLTKKTAAEIAKKLLFFYKNL